MLSTFEAGIKTILYINPVMPQNAEYELSDLKGSYASARAMDCSGNAVPVYNGTGLLSDPRTPAASSYYADVVSYYVNHQLLPYRLGRARLGCDVHR